MKYNVSRVKRDLSKFSRTVAKSIKVFPHCSEIYQSFPALSKIYQILPALSGKVGAVHGGSESDAEQMTG